MPRYFLNVEDEDHQIKDVEGIDKSDRLIEACCMPSRQRHDLVCADASSSAINRSSFLSI